MLLATRLLVEFAKFLQIISWIVLPVLFMVVSLTILVHYRRKRKRNDADQNSFEDMLISAQDADHESKSKGAYVLFDHSGLIRQYRNKLSYNLAKYTALKHDFEKLERKYQALTDAGKSRIVNLKYNNMENTTEQLVSRMTEEFAAEKNELLSRLEQLDRSYKSLEAENESLLEQVNMQSATEEDKAIIVTRWKEENALLKTQLQEKDYLSDLLEEKKAQIEFLQNQADQRIRNYHQAERKHEEARIVAEDKTRELDNKQQLLVAKENHIIYLENVVQELKEQNDMLQAAVADSHDRAGAMQQQLDDERARLSFAEQKLNANKQLLHRLYKEFSACMQTEEPVSPVVALHPSYISKVSEE